MPYKKRYLVAHETKCSGEIDGFVPVVEKTRFVFRCRSCGKTLRR
jgi:hypothetical protein